MGRFIFLAVGLVLLLEVSYASTAKIVQELVSVGLKTRQGVGVISRVLKKSLPYGTANSIVKELLDSPRGKSEIARELLLGITESVDPKYLEGINLSNGDFKGIKLVGVKILKGNFSGANLEGADISGSDLFGSNFSSTNLSGVIYNLDTRLPLFFNPKAQNMLSANGKEYGKYTYFFANFYNRPLLFQCSIGLPLGILATVAARDIASYDYPAPNSVLGILRAEGVLLIAAAPWGVDFLITRSLAPKKVRVMAGYSCAAIGGVSTEVIFQGLK